MRKLDTSALQKAQGRRAYELFEDDPDFVTAIAQLANQKATIAEARRAYLDGLPSHIGTAQQFALAVVWLQGQE